MNARWTIDLYPASWQREFGTRFRSTLDHQDASIGDTFDLIAGAARAHLQPDPAWQSTPEPAAGSFPARPATGMRRSTLWSIALWAHISLYVVVSLILVGVNFMATPDNLWFGWPIWGWGIAIAAHIGISYGSPPWLLPHAMVSIWVQIGLVAISIAQGGPFWAIWPVWALMSLLVVHALRATNRIDDFGAHLALAVLASAELLAVAAVSGASFGEMLIAIGYVAVTVVVHALYRFGNPTLLQAHLVAFVSISGLLVIDSLDEGSRWFVYPVVAWAAIVLAHAVVARQPIPETGAWEREMLMALRSGNRSSSDQASARRRLRLAGLRWHLIVAGLLLAILAVIDLATPGDGWWIVWPLSIWLVIFAGHVGMVLFANHPALGLHLVGGGAAIAWLFVLDMRTGPPAWWFWPAIVWVVLGIVVFSMTVDLLRGFGDDRAPDNGT